VPLINDYVQVQYRGRATSLLNQGQIAGNLLSVAVLFTLTQMVDPWVGFAMIMLILYMAAGTVYYCIEEP
jgi:hypothetical protein